MTRLNWRRRHWITNPQRRYWEAEAGEGQTYTIEPVPFRGWQAALNRRRADGGSCVLPPLMKSKAEAVAWCEADFAQREMELVGIA